MGKILTTERIAITFFRGISNL